MRDKKFEGTVGLPGQVIKVLDGQVGTPGRGAAHVLEIKVSYRRRCPAANGRCHPVSPILPDKGFPSTSELPLLLHDNIFRLG